MKATIEVEWTEDGGDVQEFISGVCNMLMSALIHLGGARDPSIQVTLSGGVKFLDPPLRPKETKGFRVLDEVEV